MRAEYNGIVTLTKYNKNKVITSKPLLAHNTGDNNLFNLIYANLRGEFDTTRRPYFINIIDSNNASILRANITPTSILLTRSYTEEGVDCLRFIYFINYGSFLNPPESDHNYQLCLFPISYVNYSPDTLNSNKYAYLSISGEELQLEQEGTLSISWELIIGNPAN